MTQTTPTPVQAKVSGVSGASGASGGAWLWPGIVIGILSVHASACLIVAYIATSDPSQAVVPNYHAKAVAWDAHRAEQRQSAALGWTCDIETAFKADMLGQRNLRISLRDADGAPLTGTVVSLSLYHHARANDVVNAQPKETAPGEYTAMIDMRRDGLWAFDIQVQHGADHYTAQINQQVGPKVWNPGGTP